LNGNIQKFSSLLKRNGGTKEVVDSAIDRNFKQVWHLNFFAFAQKERNEKVKDWFAGRKGTAKQDLNLGKDLCAQKTMKLKVWGVKKKCREQKGVRGGDLSPHGDEKR